MNITAINCTPVVTSYARAHIIKLVSRGSRICDRPRVSSSRSRLFLSLSLSLLMRGPLPCDGVVFVSFSWRFGSLLAVLLHVTRLPSFGPLNASTCRSTTFFGSFVSWEPVFVELFDGDFAFTSLLDTRTVYTPEM